MEGHPRSGENQNPRSLSMSVATLTSNEGTKEFKSKTAAIKLYCEREHSRSGKTRLY
jgi:hypothetical protein